MEEAAAKESAISAAPAKRVRSKLFCGHCTQLLPKSTFYRHKEKFYNSVSSEWQREPEGKSAVLPAEPCRNLYPVESVSCTEMNETDGDIPVVANMADMQYADLIIHTAMMNNDVAWRHSCPIDSKAESETSSGDSTGDHVDNSEVCLVVHASN